MFVRDFAQGLSFRDQSVFVGANTNQGAAYVFVRSGTNWSQQQQLTAGDSDVQKCMTHFSGSYRPRGRRWRQAHTSIFTADPITLLLRCLLDDAPQGVSRLDSRLHVTMSIKLPAVAPAALLFSRLPLASSPGQVGNREESREGQPMRSFSQDSPGALIWGVEVM